MVQEPETSFPDDVTATKRVLDLQDGPTLLVRHSYGGSIITKAGVHPNVVGLVYVAAHAPDVGENESALGKRASWSRRPARSGKRRMNSPISTRRSFQRLFAPDLPRERAEFVARSQVLAAAKVFSTPQTAAAWKTNPSLGNRRQRRQSRPRALALCKGQEPHHGNQGRQPLGARIPCKGSGGGDRRRRPEHRKICCPRPAIGERHTKLEADNA